MNAPAPAQSLVVVAIDIGARDDAILEIAGRLVPGDTPELLGLFVENDELLEHARSRYAREILLTGAVRALDRTALERQLRAQAARVRARFEAASARLGLRSRFEVARGHVVELPVRRAATAGALVLSATAALSGPLTTGAFLSRITAAELPFVLLARTGPRRGEGIVAILTDPARTGPTLEASARLAGHATPVTVLMALDEDADRETIETGIVARLNACGVSRCRVIPVGESPAAIAILAQACHPKVLVLPLPSSAVESAIVETILHRSFGPLALVRQ